MALVGDGKGEVGVGVGVEASLLCVEGHQEEVAVGLFVEGEVGMHLDGAGGGVIHAAGREAEVEEVLDERRVALEGELGGGVVELAGIVASQIVPLDEFLAVELAGRGGRLGGACRGRWGEGLLQCPDLTELLPVRAVACAGRESHQDKRRQREGGGESDLFHVVIIV